MMKGFAGPAMAAMGGGQEIPSMDLEPAVSPVEGGVADGGPVQMTAEEARAIVEKAVQEGSVTAEQAAGLLAGETGASAAMATEPARKSSFWSRFTGKK